MGANPYTLQIFWLQKLQLLAVLRVQLQSGCNICNHQLQLFLVAIFATLSCKQLVALFAPISCNLEEKRKITSLGLEPMTFHTKPSRSTE